MKRLAVLFSFLLLAASFEVVLPSVASAQKPFDPKAACAEALKEKATAKDNPICSDTNVSENPLSGKNGIILKAANLLSMVIGVLSVLMIILGGWAYMTSTGDPHKITGAKNTILYAIIGVVIAATAQAMVLFVFQRVT